MNWLIVVVAGVFVMGTLNWVLNSRYHFKGPKGAIKQSHLSEAETPKADDDEAENPVVSDYAAFEMKQVQLESTL